MADGIHVTEALDGSGATLIRELAKWLDHLDEAKREAATRTPSAS